jgi:hypothetical protein
LLGILNINQSIEMLIYLYTGINTRIGQIVFNNMEIILDRFVLLVQVENVKMPWLEEQTGVVASRWNKVKTGQNEMRASDVEALVQVWPEYAYWLATGKEIIEAGQISPLTRREYTTSKTAPKVRK